MDTCTVRHPSHRFTKQPGNKLVAEASDLAPAHRPDLLFGPVYDDACDKGFAIVGTRSGREAVFAIDHTDQNAEGEVREWELIPTRKTLRTLPHLVGLRVIVYND